MENVTISNEAYKDILVSIRGIQETLAQLSDRKKVLANDYIDSWEACRILKISRRTLERYRNDKRIPFYKVNRKVFFKLNDLEHYLFQQSNQIHEALT